MKFLSLCSGIEAASVAFEPLGWDAVGFAEINPFASAVLAHRSNPQPGGPCHPLAATGHPPAVALSAQIRRLTPRENERLQGFPDDWTLIPWRKKPADQCPDGPRYQATGNSWAVPCARWIGERIDSAIGGAKFKVEAA